MFFFYPINNMFFATGLYIISIKHLMDAIMLKLGYLHNYVVYTFYTIAIYILCPFNTFLRRHKCIIAQLNSGVVSWWGSFCLVFFPCNLEFFFNFSVWLSLRYFPVWTLFCQTNVEFKNNFSLESTLLRTIYLFLL